MFFPPQNRRVPDSGQKRLMILTVVIVVLGVVGWLFWPPEEPFYKGKPLTAWLEGYGATGWGSRDLRPPEESQVVEAMRQVGTNAIPTLLRMLQAKDSTLKLRLVKLGQKQPFIKIRYVPATKCNHGAAYGFEILGTSAQDSVPALIDIYEQHVSAESQSATAKSLGSIGPAARKAVPSLIGGASSTNLHVRRNSLLALIQIRAEPELVVPILMKSLHDPEIREYAALGIGLFGLDGHGRQVVPELVQALKDPDEFVRRVAEQSLKEIDPETAAKAGVK